MKEGKKTAIRRPDEDGSEPDIRCLRRRRRKKEEEIFSQPTKKIVSGPLVGRVLKRVSGPGLDNKDENEWRAVGCQIEHSVMPRLEHVSKSLLTKSALGKRGEKHVKMVSLNIRPRGTARKIWQNAKQRGEDSSRVYKILFFFFLHFEKCKRIYSVADLEEILSYFI